MTDKLNNRFTIQHLQDKIKILKNDVNRLQAENKDLQKVVVEDFASEYDNKIKAEAYKEFAYELKQIPRKTIHKNEVDNLLKELVGEQPTPNNVKCIDCEYLELELPYAVCSKAYKGIVQPNDSCGKGKLKEMGGDNNETKTF